jgi:RNA polymerase sigma factor (sigma-70 family)
MHPLDTQSAKQQAEQTANQNYTQLQTEVLSTVRRRLSSRKMRLDDSDLEEAYCQAWHGVYETIKRGNPVVNLTGMLIEITWRRAVDIYRELRPSQRTSLEPEEPALELDLDTQLDDQIRLKRLITLARNRLNPRECEAIGLCIIHGYSRPEAAKLMGLNRRQIEKLMDAATKKIGGIVTAISTRGCGGDEWARLMRSYALGLIAENDRDYPRAAEHIAQCATCRRYVNALRGLAAVLPPALPFGPLANTGHSGSFLTHLLSKLFRHSHSGSITNIGTTTSTATAGTSGASLINTGAITKGVAILAAGAAALALASHSKHHTVAQEPSPAQTRVPINTGATTNSAAASTYQAATTLQSIRSSPLARHRLSNSVAKTLRVNAPSHPRPQKRASELGIEDGARYSPPSASPTPPALPTHSTPVVDPTAPMASSVAVNHEFGFER